MGQMWNSDVSILRPPSVCLSASSLCLGLGPELPPCHPDWHKEEISVENSMNQVTRSSQLSENKHIVLDQSLHPSFAVKFLLCAQPFAGPWELIVYKAGLRHFPGLLYNSAVYTVYKQPTNQKPNRKHEKKKKIKIVMRGIFPGDSAG